MGLFGLFYTLFCGGAAIGKEVRDQWDMGTESLKAREKGSDFYTDRTGTLRNTYTHNPIHITTVSDIIDRKNYGKPGDRCMIDLKTGNVIKNYAQDKRDKLEAERKKFCIEHNGVAYRLGLDAGDHDAKDDYYFHDKCRGYRYKDINTGELYVVRTFNHRKYFMSVESGKLICRTTPQKLYDEANGLERVHEQMMEEFERDWKSSKEFFGDHFEYFYNENSWVTDKNEY